MFQAAYAPEAWKALVKRPNRLDVIRPVVRNRRHGRRGRTFSGSTACSDLPAANNVSAAAFSMAGPLGAVKAIKTTTLMTIEKSMEAMRKATSRLSAASS